VACPIPLNLVCDAVGGASSSLAGGVLSAIAGWVVQGATWLLNALGGAISQTTSVDVRAPWFVSHYQVMLTIAAVVAVPMLMLTAIQALYHQSGALLVRAAFVHLPLAGLLTAAAVQLVQLSLAATDALCSEVTKSTGGELAKTLSSIGTALSHQLMPLPTFVMTVGALLIVTGAFFLWLELLVRSAAIYAAVLFLPLALVSLVWPPVSHWSRRLVETLAALVLSKFVVVAVLSLAVGAVSSGHGFSTVLAGGALLLLAAFTPFTLLRLVPLVEAGAVTQLEGARQRVRGAWGRAPDSAVGFALRQAREHGAHRETPQPTWTPGLPGTGTTVPPEAPGSPGPAGSGGAVSDPGGSGGRGSGGRGSGGRGAGPGEASLAGVAGWGAGAAARGAAGGWAPVEAGGSTEPGATDELGMPGTRDLAGGPQPTVGPVRRGWPPPEDSTPPPGTIPVWEGVPESTEDLLEALRRATRVEPDGYGGIIPGVASPLWGGTEPLSRFEPGPRDVWPGWHPGEDGSWDDEPLHDGLALPTQDGGTAFPTPDGEED